MKRFYTNILQNELLNQRQMLFVSGPRQVGKTTLARDTVTQQQGHYYNWDNRQHRQWMLDSIQSTASAVLFEQLGVHELRAQRGLVAFDELHKYKDWKNYLKGVFDLYEQQLAILVTGSARMVVFSDLSIGEMLAVFSYLWFMMGPVQEVLGIQYSWYGAKAALQRINSLLEKQAEPNYPHLHNPFAGKTTVSVRAEHITFAYGDKPPVLKDVNLHITAGQKIALVGASGGGKSTFMQVLLGLYQPQQGQLYFDDIPVTEIGLDVVREHVATVLQHPALFNDTIRANLTLGRELPDAKLWEALRIAQLDGTIAAQADGLDTIVGRQGMRLSGGQRQRLAIARMVLSEPKVVILDEATSALDTDTEQKLHAAMSTFLQGRTTLIIAHRLSAVRQADHIFVFEDGGISEQGSHAQLLEQDGLYRKLYGES